MKKLKYILMVGLLSLLAVSCSSKPSNKGDYYEPGGNQQQNGEKFEGALGDNNIIIPEGHKIIYTVEYELRIEEEIASTIKVINQEVYTLNGYIQTSSDSLSYATYVYKVPTENLNTFLNKVDEQEGVSSKKIASEDVTSQYNEIQAEIEVLEASRLAYLKMLEEDGLSLNDVITLNDKIKSIDTQLKKLYKNKESFDARIDYATITINYKVINAPIKEVFLGDYGNFLLNLGKTIVEFLAYSAPFVVIAGAGIGIVVLVKKTKKKGNK